MKKKILNLFVLLFVSGFVFSINASADNNHRGQGNDPRHSYSQNSKGHDKGYSRNGKNYQKDIRKNDDKRWKAQQKADERRWKEHQKFDKKMHHEQVKRQQYYDRRLHDMVHHVSYGSPYVRVWQINPETYIVRYMRNGRYYTQRIYPYSGRYGGRNEVNINWSPETPWMLLPSFNINISL